MKDVFWKTCGTSFGFVLGVVNYRLCSLVPLDSRPGREAGGWAVEGLTGAAFLRMESPPDNNTWTGRRLSPSWFLSLLDIRLLFSGWGKATLSTRETLQGRGSWAG